MKEHIIFNPYSQIIISLSSFVCHKYTVINLINICQYILPSLLLNLGRLCINFIKVTWVQPKEYHPCCIGSQSRWYQSILLWDYNYRNHSICNNMSTIEEQCSLELIKFVGLNLTDNIIQYDQHIVGSLCQLGWCKLTNKLCLDVVNILVCTILVYILLRLTSSANSISSLGLSLGTFHWCTIVSTSLSKRKCW